MESLEAGPLLEITLMDLPGSGTAEPLRAFLRQEGRYDRGWLILCVPPGPTLEIIVTVIACESPRRINKMSIVRQTKGLLKVYVNPEVMEMDEWEVEGNSVRLLMCSARLRKRPRAARKRCEARKRLAM